MLSKRSKLFFCIIFAVILTITGYVLPAPSSISGITLPAWAKTKKVTTVKTKKIKMTVGQSKKLTARKLKGKIKWKSSNKKVVSVNKKGKVSARKPGTVKITAASKGKRYVFKVTVKSSGKKKDGSSGNSKDTGKGDFAAGSGDEDPLEVHFIDVGQGDSILLKCQGKAMMVDFGDNSKGTYLQNYLMKQGIKSLEYAVGTHPDADHLGGMDVTLYKFPVSHVLMPDVTYDTATFRDVIDTCRGKGYKIEHPKAGDTFKLGGASVQVLAPVSSKYSDMNSYSIVLRISIGKDSFLLTGDATADSESEMLSAGRDLSAAVLKVGHHGSSSSTSDVFLKNVSPSFAVISYGKDNPYGHPHAAVMNKLKKAGVKILRTDLQGSVIAKTSGSGIIWSTAPTDDYKGGSVSGCTSDLEPVAGVQYILNTNTMKYHLPGCSAAKKIADKNRAESGDSAAVLEEKGFSPCGICLK